MITRPYPLSACRYCTTNEAESNCFLNDADFTCRPALKRLDRAQKRWKIKYLKAYKIIWEKHLDKKYPGWRGNKPTSHFTGSYDKSFEFIVNTVCEYMEGK